MNKRKPVPPNFNRNHKSSFPCTGGIAAAKLSALILCFVVIAGALSGCSAVLEGLFSQFLEERPTAEDTYTDLTDVSNRLGQALENGETKVTLNVTATESEIKNITENMSSFWGWPDTYVVAQEFSDVKLTEEEGADPIPVKRVNFNLRLSNNYYALNAWKDSDFTIPASMKEAAAIYQRLQTVIPEIFGNDLNASGAAILGDYDSTLAVHDWLVTNLTYDDSIDQSGSQNGSFGALTLGKTMCQGYSETMQLILKCATDVQVEMQVGEGDSGDGVWIGHAWNRVLIDDVWYHVDATFDDPLGNPAKEVNHYYFGQNDAAMQADHKWNADYWSPVVGGDFLWYRKNGLYAENKKKFQAIVTNQLKNKKKKKIEIATKGFKVAEADLQFIFSEDENIKALYHNTTKVSDVTVVGLDIKYR